MNDPLVDEIRRIRDDHAARFNYDLDAIFRDIKEQERKSGRKFVFFSADNAAPNKTLQPNASVTPVSRLMEAPKAAPTAENLVHAARQRS